jgi:predicted N-acetyltransferase YhbS
MIRLATPADGAKLWALAEEFLASQRDFGAPDQRRALAAILAHGVKAGESVVVAEQDGELVGFVAWSALPNAADGEVVGGGTFVSPFWRGSGLSNRMRAFAKEHCRKKGHRFVSGAVWKGNDSGMRSVEHSGGRVVGYLVEWRL